MFFIRVVDSLLLSTVQRVNYRVMADCFMYYLSIDSISDIFVGDTIMDWYDARDWCEERGTDLVSVHDNQTQHEAEVLCDTIDSGIYGCWIGLHQNSTAMGLYRNWVCFVN